jgi:competence protein ComEA
VVQKPSLPNSLINLNTASPEALDGLPGIGPVLAGRIVAERERRPFTSVDDLRRVGGIGPKKLEAIRPLVTVGD